MPRALGAGRRWGCAFSHPGFKEAVQGTLGNLSEKLNKLVRKQSPRTISVLITVVSFLSFIFEKRGGSTADEKRAHERTC